MGMRVTQAARYLDVSPSSIRNWANSGELSHTINVNGQRIFTEDDLDRFKAERTGTPPPVGKTVFYVRSSDGNDVTMDTQVALLTKAVGTPDHIYRDKSSGLNEKRKGLTALLNAVERGDVGTVVVTSEDRLTRFGVSYLRRIFESNNTTLKVLDSPEDKEPTEALMSDFMALFASFSGRFYRLRGWENQRKLLNDVSRELERRSSGEHVKTVP